LKDKPNILLIQVDQLAAPALAIYGHRLVKTPNIDRLAENGIVFDRAYCNSPICAPSRFSMLTGRLPAKIGVYDNGSEFPASIPTIAHYLSLAGYSTTLCGKMHFVGPDQLHGYEERLTTEIYPADFIWTPDWRLGPQSRPSGLSMRPVLEAGVCRRSLQIDYDEQVAFMAEQKLYDLARYDSGRPFFLTVSFTHPHSPYTVQQAYWDLYRHEDIPMPRVGEIAFDRLDTYSQWLHQSHGRDEDVVTDEHVRTARHAYFGMISYVDALVGRVLAALADAELADNTVVIFTSDHGEMLGERGMWYKETFFEWSARVPLIVSSPSRLARGTRSPALVSLLDLLPTVCDLVGTPQGSVAGPIEGRSFLAHLERPEADDPTRSIIGEYTDMGVCGPCRMVRQGEHKLVFAYGAAPLLFDLARDPDELHSLAGRSESAALERQLSARLTDGWDPDGEYQAVLLSQARRRVVKEAMQSTSASPNWSHVVRQGDERRFVRGSGFQNGTTATKAKARFPRLNSAR